MTVSSTGTLAAALQHPRQGRQRSAMAHPPVSARSRTARASVAATRRNLVYVGRC
uniref:Uncharacterized protein n=1 Tax=Arundo donax TaxID=35708 RepID=A0A0A9AQU2_ARUDO